VKYSIVQDIPGRLRVFLTVPRFPAVDRCQVEAQFKDMAGVESVSFSPRTATLLVRHDRKHATRVAILERVAAAPIPSPRRAKPETELEQKKKTAVRAGLMLLARPLIPPPIRPVLAIYGALPYLKKGVIALRRKELNVDLLDASAISAAMATREFFTASVIVTLLKVGDYLSRSAITLRSGPAGNPGGFSRTCSTPVTNGPGWSGTVQRYGCRLRRW